MCVLLPPLLGLQDDNHAAEKNDTPFSVEGLTACTVSTKCVSFTVVILVVLYLCRHLKRVYKRQIRSLNYSLL